MLGRLKFDISKLVEEILDQLPNEVWTSSVSTFLDPAMAGGQFVSAIERRLHNNGHSDENIASRVFGFESNPMRINYAVNKYRLVGNYIASDFLEADIDMKFDNIVGNPPYQNTHKKDGESKRKVGNKLWYQFIFKADNLLKENGHVALVTPTQWLSGGIQMRKGQLGVLKDIFSVKQLKVAKVANITEKYFKKIGINIGYFVYENIDNYGPSKIILKDGEIDLNLKDIQFLTPEPTGESIRIVQKVLLANNPKFETYYFNAQCKPDAYKETDDATDKNKYLHWIMGSDVTDNLVQKYFPVELNAKVGYKKVLFPMSTRYWQPYLADKDVNVATLGQALKVDEKTTQAGFESVFYSKLFKYLCFNLQIAQNGFMKTVLVKALPKLDMSKVWTDQELYNHFDLTQEERNYIDENVE